MVKYLSPSNMKPLRVYNFVVVVITGVINSISCVLGKHIS